VVNGHLHYLIDNVRDSATETTKVKRSFAKWQTGPVLINGVGKP